MEKPSSSFRPRLARIALSVLCAMASACGGGETPSDAGTTRDGATTPDSGPRDATTPAVDAPVAPGTDSGTPGTDSGTPETDGGTSIDAGTASADAGADASASDGGGPEYRIRINEVESNGDATDWVELHNAGSTAVDISGWYVRDSGNGDGDRIAIPANTVLQPGAYYTIDVTPAFGLGNDPPGEQVRLRLPADTEATQIDSFLYANHAVHTYGRCPNGAGPLVNTFASTRNAANNCPTSSTGATWPGGTTVTTRDAVAAFGENMSGLTYQPASGGNPAVLWAVRNDVGTLFRLLRQAGGGWASDTANGWTNGKPLLFPNGLGNPDAEGVTLAAYTSSSIYAAIERDGSGANRFSILRFDTTDATASLTAELEWNLTPEVPTVPQGNRGFEAITWIPDGDLSAGGFRDQVANAAYDPATEGAHAAGLFFAGLEWTGAIYAFVLRDDGNFRRVATIPTGQVSVMDLSYDRDSEILWATCDDTCNNLATAFVLDQTVGSPTRGQFIIAGVFAPPSGLAVTGNNEGFAVADDAVCAAGTKPVFWLNDSDLEGFSLREGTISCDPLP